MGNIVWHRRDLRAYDNNALASAGEDALPVFIFDPEWLENDLVSDTRIEFVLQSLKDLNRQYVEKGSHLAVLKGTPIDKLTELQSHGHQIYFNRDSNHFRQEMEGKARKRFKGAHNSAVNTSGSRPENWKERAQKWFKGELIKSAARLDDNTIENETSLDQIRREYSLAPEKEEFGKGGTKKARERLDKFLERISGYSGCISSPSKAESSTSHLSPYIRYGCISPREVYQKADKKKQNAENKRSVEMFKDRIFWQQHFNQKLEDNPDLFKEAINPTYRDLHKENRDPEKIDAWKSGKTGFPLVDASMRALVQTGWLNFRMRAMCASFYSYILKQWWKTGADFYYKHLIDADVAINYYQWQMQSGLVGVHANRIYNPMKQVKDNDPDGKFIRKYVPELRSLPDKYIAKPWEMPVKVQQECGIIIGNDYPKPVVNYEREARKARKFFKAKAPEAYASFRDDEVWRKASLSSRHARESILKKADDSQKDLNSFG